MNFTHDNFFTESIGARLWGAAADWYGWQFYWGKSQVVNRVACGNCRLSCNKTCIKPSYPGLSYYLGMCAFNLYYFIFIRISSSILMPCCIFFRIQILQSFYVVYYMLFTLYSQQTSILVKPQNDNNLYYYNSQQNILLHLPRGISTGEAYKMCMAWDPTIGPPAHLCAVAYTRIYY